MSAARDARSVARDAAQVSLWLLNELSIVLTIRGCAPCAVWSDIVDAGGAANAGADCVAEQTVKNVAVIAREQLSGCDSFRLSVGPIVKLRGYH